jgi:hypothetical protein
MPEAETASAAAIAPDPSGESAAVPSAKAAAPLRLIQTANLLIRDQDVEGAALKIEQKVIDLGGYVANSKVNRSVDDQVTATLTARVPPENFRGIIRFAQKDFKVERLDSGTEDVSEKYVDLESRLRNKKRHEERLLEILSTRTGSVNDLTSMEREVARVREEVELLEGKLRLLGSQTRLSTVTMRIVTPEAAPVTARFGGDFWSAVASAFTSSSGTLKLCLQYGLMAGAYVLPFAAALAGLAILLKALAWLKGPRKQTA